MIQKIENLIDLIEKDIAWHELESITNPFDKKAVAHVGASGALQQVVNDLKNILYGKD